MSGIVGIVNRNGAPVERDLLSRMTEFMSFRGPDAQDSCVKGNVAFGHAMLRSTWEADAEQQPLTLNGATWLTADARLDGPRRTITRELWFNPKPRPCGKSRVVVSYSADGCRNNKHEHYSNT